MAALAEDLAGDGDRAGEYATEWDRFGMTEGGATIFARPAMPSV